MDSLKEKLNNIKPPSYEVIVDKNNKVTATNDKADTLQQRHSSKSLNGEYKPSKIFCSSFKKKTCSCKIKEREPVVV